MTERRRIESIPSDTARFGETLTVKNIPRMKFGENRAENELRRNAFPKLRRAIRRVPSTRDFTN